MNKIDKIKNLSLLFDTYKQLLTDKQTEVFIYYYLEDLSMTEIADILKISKVAVSDTIKQTEKKLIELENKLSIVDRNIKISKELDKSKDEKLVKKIKELL